MVGDQPIFLRLVWLALIVFAAIAMFQSQWRLAFVSGGTLVISLAPVFVVRWADVKVPSSFMIGVVLFVGGTLFLGEVYDFYERFWWWDIVMHFGSAVAFGLTGFILVFMMFQGDRFAAPPFALAFFAFCFALSLGTVWEIFEFSMDLFFDLNMQKSGLRDTMGDLIVNTLGAAIGATAGYAYLNERKHRGLSGVIDEFVRRNPRFFKNKRK